MIWNGNIFPLSVAVKVNVILRLLGLPAKPTRVEIFAAIVVRPTLTNFDGVWSLLSTKDFEMLCFSIMLAIQKWCWRPASFLAPSGTSTFLVVSIRLQNPSIWRILHPHIYIVSMFLRDKSSLLLSKTFAVVDAVS